MVAETHDAIARARELMRADVGEGDDDRGYLDLIGGDVRSTGPAQSLMLTRAVPAIYERWWRPALGQLAKGALGPGTAEEVRIARLLLLRRPPPLRRAARSARRDAAGPSPRGADRDHDLGRPAAHRPPAQAADRARERHAGVRAGRDRRRASRARLRWPPPAPRRHGSVRRRSAGGGGS